MDADTIATGAIALPDMRSLDASRTLDEAPIFRGATGADLKKRPSPKRDAAVAFLTQRL